MEIMNRQKFEKIHMIKMMELEIYWRCIIKSCKCKTWIRVFDWLIPHHHMYWDDFMSICLRQMFNYFDNFCASKRYIENPTFDFSFVSCVVKINSEPSLPLHMVSDIHVWYIIVWNLKAKVSWSFILFEMGHCCTQCFNFPYKESL